jgi:septal ring factor EnvC (AmiA/AmiB activator)
VAKAKKLREDYDRVAKDRRLARQAEEHLKQKLANEQAKTRQQEAALAQTEQKLQSEIRELHHTISSLEFKYESARAEAMQALKQLETTRKANVRLSDRLQTLAALVPPAGFVAVPSENPDAEQMDRQSGRRRSSLAPAVTQLTFCPLSCS